MINKEKDYIKVSENEANSNEVEQEPFFSEEPIINISPTDNRAILRTNLILNYIKENPLCTPYKISKKLEIAYTVVSRTVKELIFVNAIAYRVEIGENNRTHKLLFVPEEVEND